MTLKYSNLHRSIEDTRDQDLAFDITQQQLLITPDEEIDGGKSRLQHNLDLSLDSIAELEEMLRKKHTDLEKMSILKTLKAHQEDADKFRKSLNEIPQVIKRLERIKAARSEDIALLTIEKNIPTAILKDYLKNIDLRLEVSGISEKEKRVLTLMKQKIDTLKSIKDSGVSDIQDVNDVKIYLFKSELKYVTNFIKDNDNLNREVVIQALNTLSAELLVEKSRLKSKSKSHLSEIINTPILAIQTELGNIINTQKIDPNTIKKTVETVKICMEDIQKAKEAAPSLKDKMRNLYTKFKSFAEKNFGFQIPESPNFLKSESLTNAFRLSKKSEKIANIANPTNTETPSLSDKEISSHKGPKSI